MRYRYQSGEQVYEITMERRGERFQALIDGQPFECEVLDTQPGQISLRFEGRPLTVYFAVDGGQRWLSLDGCTYHLQPPAPRAARREEDAGGGELVRSPMPALVRDVQTAPGDVVEKGQTLLLLEAMKMEIRVRAPVAGQVTRLLVAPGERVDKDQLLVEVVSKTT